VPGIVPGSYIQSAVVLVVALVWLWSASPASPRQTSDLSGQHGQGTSPEQWGCKGKSHAVISAHRVRKKKKGQKIALSVCSTHIVCPTWPARMFLVS